MFKGEIKLKRLACVILALSLMVAMVPQAAAQSIYLNEGFENAVTNGSPTGASVSGYSNIVRVVENGGGKAILQRNKKIDSVVSFACLPTGKNIIFEIMVKVNDSRSDKGVVQIAAGQEKISLVTFKQDGKIWDAQKIEIGSYKTGAWHKVSVRLNTESMRYDVYLDGEILSTRRIAGAANVGAISSVFFTSYGASSGETSMMTDFVRVYGGTELQDGAFFPAKEYNSRQIPITVDEIPDDVEIPIDVLFGSDFESDSVGSLPAGLARKTDGEVVQDPEEDNKYVAVKKTSSVESYVEIQVNNKLEHLVVEGDFYFPSIKGDIWLFLMRDTGGVFSNCLRVSGEGDVLTHNGRAVASGLNEEWVNIALIFDFNAKNFDVYANREVVLQKVGFAQSNISADMNAIRFNLRTGGDGGDEMRIDNLYAYKSDKLEVLESEDEDTNEENKEEKEPERERETVSPLNPDMTVFTRLTEEPSARPSPYFTDYEAARTRYEKSVCLIAGHQNSLIFREKYSSDYVPVLEENEMLIPLRLAGAIFNMPVTWDDATGTAKVGDISMKEGDGTLNIKGRNIPLKVPVRNIEGRLYVQLAPFADDGLDYYVGKSFKGLWSISPEKFNATTSNIVDALNYTVFERPKAHEILETVTENFPNNSHPRVIATADDFARMKQLAETDPYIKEWSDSLLRAAETSEKIKPLPQTYDSAGLRMQGFTSQATIISFYWGYYMTGEEKYFQAAREHALNMAKFPNWNAHQHFLETSAACGTMGLVFDLFYDRLSQTDKDTIVKAMLDFAIKPASEHYYGTGPSNWAVRENNWNIVCNTGVIMGTLAIIDEYEPEFCGDIIEKALRSSEYMMHTYAPEGGWMEGAGYWHYTVSNNVMMAHTLETVLGSDYGLMKTPGVMNTAYFPVFVTGNEGVFAFHDTTGKSNINSPEMFWFAGKNGDGDLSRLRLNTMEKMKYQGSFRDMLWYDPDILVEEVHLPLDYVYGYTEVATSRSDWTNSSTWIGLHAGQNHVPHGQYDIGTFEFESFGVRFANEMGLDNYNLPGYFGGPYYVHRAEGHNVYVINPDESNGQERSAETEVRLVEQKPRGTIYTIDMTPAYARQVKAAKRGFMLTEDRRMLVLQDEIVPLKAGDMYYWFWHTEADIEIAEDGKSALLQRDGRELKLYVDANVDFFIDSDKSLPLPTSPNNPAQLNNLTRIMNKLVITFASGTEQINFRVTAVPETIEYKQTPLTPISEWSIPDGELSVEYNYLEDILVDGKSIDGFEKTTSMYYVPVYEAGDTPPIVSAVGSEDAVVVQGTNEKPVATIKILSEDGTNPFMYFINFIHTPKKEKPTEGEKLEVVDVEASAVPEVLNVPKNTIDGDLSTRWSAEGVQWISLDLGEARTITSVGLSIYQGDARRQFFDVQVSMDGKDFVDVVSAQTSGTGPELEYLSIPPTEAHYVRIRGRGNSANSWNSITEIEIYGK